MATARPQKPHLPRERMRLGHDARGKDGRFLAMPATRARGFALIYPSMIVRVTGRNLAEVVHAISAGTCGRIREYHSKLYDPPPPDAPLIQEITIIAADEEPTK